MPQPAKEKENLWDLTFLAGEGLGQGRGRLDFIELEAARNLIICDVRSEVSCQEEDRKTDQEILSWLCVWGPRRHREFPGLLPQFPGTCVAPVLSEEAPGILFFLPGESGTHRYPYFKRFCLSLPGPPGTSPRLSLAPESRISRQRFAAPRWSLEEKQGLVLRARSRRAVWLAGFR